MVQIELMQIGHAGFVNELVLGSNSALPNGGCPTKWCYQVV
jgi:hypothetical protein